MILVFLQEEAEILMWLDLNVGMSSLGIDFQNFSISNFCTWWY
jgi:hypothetical protein